MRHTFNHKLSYYKFLTAVPISLHETVTGCFNCKDGLNLCQARRWETHETYMSATVVPHRSDNI